MKQLVDLAQHKEDKLNEVISKDLTQVSLILNTAIDLLHDYKHYIPVMESISCLQTNKTLIDTHVKKHKKKNG